MYKNYLKQKTFSIIRKLGLLGSFLFFGLYFVKNIWNLLFDRFSYKAYSQSIQKAITRKKIVLDIPYKGLGDWAVFTSLPRLLYKKYGADFYITKKSYEKLSNKDIAELLFLKNPYFKGFVEEYGLVFRIFSKDKTWKQIFVTQGCDSITEIIEKQFNLESIGKGIPEIFYTPQKISEYEHTILVDSNYISGKKVGWEYSQQTFQGYISKFQTQETRVEYVDVSKQDLHRYVDMMYSSKHFITVLSGGAAVHACFDKEYVCVLPYNAFGESVDQFVFKKSRAVYAK